jgi:hypothetical protein
MQVFNRQALFELLSQIPDTPILLSEQEFRHYDKDGILLADGSGYLATITMYHDMHCIVWHFRGKTQRHR